MTTATHNKCPYCRDDVPHDAPQRICQRCLTRHHDDCWHESGHCAVFGCRETRYLTDAALAESPDLVKTAPAAEPSGCAPLALVLAKVTFLLATGVIIFFALRKSDAPKPAALVEESKRAAVQVSSADTACRTKHLKGPWHTRREIKLSITSRAGRAFLKNSAAARQTYGEAYTTCFQQQLAAIPYPNSSRMTIYHRPASKPAP